MKGEYTEAEDALPVVFTDAYFSTEVLPKGADLVELGQSAEDGEITQAPFPPTPVVGSTGTLGNIYLDDVLRITTDGSPASSEEDIF